MKRTFYSITYFVGLFYIVFWAPWRKGVKLSDAERLRLHPIVDSVKELFDTHGGTWLVHAFYFFGNLFGNIVLFLPFAFVMMQVFNMKRVVKIAVLAFLLSLAIEIIQYYTESGVADVDDVLLNTTGAIAGVYLCRFFQNKSNTSYTDEHRSIQV
ncbi:VanZ family protein [Chitinophaga sancti]|uniref:VanZ family protein n=1 Tax=Chitinophaga sancti TaxID=1004 RepID=UPI002A75D2F9|nr:VanZ family protein [Chitinophaga sancti]WPQ65736.1 VanZ family protein [Chitinophaga sancti]